MIVVDKLCYRSRLRYVNAAEKVCIFHDNSAVLCSQPLTHRCRRGVCSQYIPDREKRTHSGGAIRKAAGGAFYIPDIEYTCDYSQYLKSPTGCLCNSSGQLFYHRELSFPSIRDTADCDSHGECVLPVLFISQYDDDRYSGRAGKTALPRDIDGTHASDLPVHLCAHGDCFRHDGVTEVQAGQQRSANIGEFLRKDGGGPAAPRI